jgi:hypothetical protein
VSLGKAWLVSRLQVLLQTWRLRLPRPAEAEALAQELLDYAIRVDENANEKCGRSVYGAGASCTGARHKRNPACTHHAGVATYSTGTEEPRADCSQARHPGAGMHMVPNNRTTTVGSWPIALSAARWARLDHLIATYDQPADVRCSPHTARGVVVALLYRALTGAPWSALPTAPLTLPLLLQTYYRWRQLGLLDRLAPALGVWLA